MIDNTIHPLITFAGSGVAGFFMGMFLRRVLKFLVMIIGSFLGAVFFSPLQRLHVDFNGISLPSLLYTSYSIKFCIWYTNTSNFVLASYT